MGCPLMGHHGWKTEGEEGTFGPPSAFFVPAPMAFFGMLVALMFGAVMGAAAAKKSMMMHAMSEGRPGMKGHMHHHHHGHGYPACRHQHEGWGQMPEETGTEGQ